MFHEHSRLPEAYGTVDRALDLGDLGTEFKSLSWLGRWVIHFSSWLLKLASHWMRMRIQQVGYRVASAFVTSSRFLGVCVIIETAAQADL